MEEKIGLIWISEKMGMSCAHLEKLLGDRISGDSSARFVTGFDFFHWFFLYRPDIITDQYRAFWFECNDILYKKFNRPQLNSKANEN